MDGLRFLRRAGGSDRGEHGGSVVCFVYIAGGRAETAAVVLA